MATTIPTGTSVTLEADIPVGSVWPGPPAWSPSDPANATITLVDGSLQFQATIQAVSPTTGTPITVTIHSAGLMGTMDFTVQDGAQLPTQPVIINLS